jgi:Zn-dependent peptidase ImmA (M78 family)/transcriptional regulator with XRE-family HTH domain
MPSGPRVYASPRPGLLAWARNSAGFDLATAAKKAGTKPERLAAWESDEARPTINQLRKLAHIYKRPIAVFYLPRPPEDISPPKDYRRLPGEVSGVESPELRYEIRRAVTRREFALELLDDAGEEPPEFRLTGDRSEPPEQLGSRIRGALGIDMDVQSSWRGDRSPFNGWRFYIERAGALVQQMTDVDVSEARGFSISEFPFPVVVVNIKDAVRGRTFSLVHELVHVTLRQSGLCDLDDTSSRSADDLRLERYCNAVAGATLVPEEQLMTSVYVREPRISPTWADEELRALARDFGVSREVILRRLLDLGLTTDDFYREKRDQFIEEYEEARRRQPGGFAPPPVVALASAGPAFAGLVLSSYEQGTITASDVSDYLGVRLKHLPRIEEQLLAQSRSA